MSNVTATYHIDQEAGFSVHRIDSVFVEPFYTVAIGDNPVMPAVNIYVTPDQLRQFSACLQTAVERMDAQLNKTIGLDAVGRAVVAQVIDNLNA